MNLTADRTKSLLKAFCIIIVFPAAAYYALWQTTNSIIIALANAFGTLGLGVAFYFGFREKIQRSSDVFKRPVFWVGITILQGAMWLPVVWNRLCNH